MEEDYFVYADKPKSDIPQYGSASESFYKGSEHLLEGIVKVSMNLMSENEARQMADNLQLARATFDV